MEETCCIFNCFPTEETVGTIIGRETFLFTDEFAFDWVDDGIEPWLPLLFAVDDAGYGGGGVAGTCWILK